MKKMLPVMAGLAGALLLSSNATAVLTGIKLVGKDPNPENPRLFICNLFITFSDPGDRLIGFFGLPFAILPIDESLFFRTNVTNGFFQETGGFGVRDFAVDAGTLGFAPLYANDTYLNIGLKVGTTSIGGIEAGSADDLSSATPVGGQSMANWNGGGKQLFSEPVFGSGFELTGLDPLVNDQNLVGAGGFPGQVFIAQLVIDLNRGTNDGGAPRIDVQIANIVWKDAAGVSQSGGISEDKPFPGEAFTAKHVVPAPGTLALLGLAGLAGIRRRRR